MGMMTSQLLSPDTPVIAQWAHEPSDHGGRDGLSDMDFLAVTKASLGMTTAECPSATAEASTELWIWRHLPGRSASYLVAA